MPIAQAKATAPIALTRRGSAAVDIRGVPVRSLICALASSSVGRARPFRRPTPSRSIPLLRNLASN